MRLLTDSRGHIDIALVSVAVFSAIAGVVFVSVSNAQSPSKKLDSKIAAYVKANYHGWKIGKKSLDPMCDNSKAYDVPIHKGGKSLSLIFKPNGTFVQTEKDVSFKKAPNLLKKKLKADFPKYTYGDTYEDVKMANSEKRWLVDLSKKGRETNEVIMRTDGTVLCTNPPISGFPPAK